MNEELAGAILSKRGITMIQALSTKETKAISIKELAEKTGIPMVTTHRIMGVLSEWSNVKSFKVRSTHAPRTLYYLKSHKFTVFINNKGVQVKVN